MLDVHGVPPTAHPFPLVNVMRADDVEPTLDREEVLAAAPATEDGRFRVPRILAQDGGHSTSNASGLLKLRYILHQHLKTRREDGFWPSGRQTRSNLVPSCLPVVQARSRWAPTHLPNNGAEAPRQTPGGS